MTKSSITTLQPNELVSTLHVSMHDDCFRDPQVALVAAVKLSNGSKAAGQPAEQLPVAGSHINPLLLCWCVTVLQCYHSCFNYIFRLELQTNLREDFTIKEKAPTRSFSCSKGPTSY